MKLKKSKKTPALKYRGGNLVIKPPKGSIVKILIKPAPSAQSLRPAPASVTQTPPVLVPVPKAPQIIPSTQPTVSPAVPPPAPVVSPVRPLVQPVVPPLAPVAPPVRPLVQPVVPPLAPVARPIRPIATPPPTSQIPPIRPLATPPPTPQTPPVQPVGTNNQSIWPYIIVVVILVGLLITLALVRWSGSSRSSEAERAALAAATMSMNNAHQALEAAADKANLAAATDRVNRLEAATDRANLATALAAMSRNNNIQVIVTNTTIIPSPVTIQAPTVNNEPPRVSYVSVPVAQSLSVQNYMQPQYMQPQYMQPQPVAQHPGAYYYPVRPYQHYQYPHYQYPQYAYLPPVRFNVRGGYQYYNGPSRPGSGYFYGRGSSSRFGPGYGCPPGGRSGGNGIRGDGRH